MNLLQRLSIAIDVTFALHHLHEHCKRPLIYCDLKPSNILDNEMIAHVSDFGLARLLSSTNDVSQNQTSTFGLKGLIGYAAPSTELLNSSNILNHDFDQVDQHLSL